MLYPPIRLGTHWVFRVPSPMDTQPKVGSVMIRIRNPNGPLLVPHWLSHSLGDISNYVVNYSESGTAFVPMSAV